MSPTPKISVPILLMVVAIIMDDCTGIVFQRERLSKSARRRQRPVICKFGKRNYTIGHTWHPNLLPQGINYCITCKCQKSGFTHCANIKCKQVMPCPGMMVPQGKCCPVCPVVQNQCNNQGKRYSLGQVWEIPINKQDRRRDNCAECICHDGKVSCGIRICPALKCLKLFQTKEKDSCCMKCRGLPLKADDDANKPKRIAERQGSCFSNGQYYANRDLWNPVVFTTDLTRSFQYPNCDVCSCQNANVTCKKILCPTLKCKNPVQKDSQDCCMSCSSKDSGSISPIINSSLPLNPRPTDSKVTYYPNCKFGEKFYQHNMVWTWSPLAPGPKSSDCVRCKCVHSRVKCDRIMCKSGGSCGTNCSKPLTQTPEPKPVVQKDCSRERVQVHLLVKLGGKKARTKHPSQFNYLVKIALLKTKSSSVEIHHWSVNNNKATVRTSKLKKVRFARRALTYNTLGEAKIGRINRFLNKEKLLASCNRNCKNKAKEYVNILKDRIRYFKNDCRVTDAFKRLS